METVVREFGVVQSHIEQIQKDICEIKKDNKHYIFAQEEMNKTLISHDTIIKVTSHQIEVIQKDLEIMKVGYYKTMGMVALITFLISSGAPLLQKFLT